MVKIVNMEQVNSMEKDEVALEISDGSEALKYSGKDRALIIYLFI